MEEGILYKLFLLSPVDDEEIMSESLKKGFSSLNGVIKKINHNIGIYIEGTCRVAAIAVNRTINTKMEEFLDKQLKLIYNHFNEVETDKEYVKSNLLNKINQFNCMYDIEFIAENSETAVQIIDAVFKTCWYSDGLILNSDGSRFINEENKLVMDDRGNSRLQFYDVKS